MQIYIPAMLILAALSVPSMAQEVQVGPERYAVSLARADVRSTTPALARQSLRRIDRAALTVCGAPRGSLREVTKSVRASACWRETVGDAVRRIDAPLLSKLWQDRREPGKPA